MSRSRWHRSLAGCAILFLLAGGCGLETLCTTTGYTPTPKPRAVLKGTLGDVPEGLAARLASAQLTARAISVDGAELARGSVGVGQEFALELPEAQDHFNVRLAIQGGGVMLKTLVPEARAGTEVQVGTLGAGVTAHALAAERSAELERGLLASMPPQVLAKVMQNAAASSDADVVAFRALVRRIVDAAEPQGEAPVLEPAGSNASDEGLAAAGVARADYEALRDRAAAAIAVPVVCDPSRLRVLFTVDVSGQALDGNGAPQFIRQQPKESKVFLGITLDPLSPVADVEGALRPRLTPNDPQTEMYDDGSHGDEVAGDKVFSRYVDLPRTMRVLYKYTDGSAGEGFTGTEEWPGNARILQVDDVLTGLASGGADCIVVRRDSFGDEATNKNFVNLNVQLGGGALDYEADLGGLEVAPPTADGGPAIGGLALGDIRELPPLTPSGIAEARENGTCQPCPPPLTVATDDREPPRLVAAAFTATDRVRATFSEDLDLATASQPANYEIIAAGQDQVPVQRVQVRGASVTLEIPQVAPEGDYVLAATGIADASADKNVIAAGSAVGIGPDRTPPSLLAAAASTITEVNPAARPDDPSTGQVVVLEFDEILDRISAEDAANYHIAGDSGQLQVWAAFQRGRQVLLVTDTQSRNGAYVLTAAGPFDVAGNMLVATDLSFRGLALYRVRFGALVDYAFLSIDGSQRGLPTGDALYLTGTVLLYARGADGRDLRVNGRSDVAGIDGYAFAASAERVAGQPVHRLELFLPAGSYAWKVAHGRPASAIDPPTTLEAVTKNLCTTNDDTGVTVDPITLLGRDGVSYANARLSLTGNDTPGPEVVFKRENPDERLVVATENLELPVFAIGAWRDVPFGSGADYDDGRVEHDFVYPGLEDTAGPRLLDARAPCSAGVLLSFDEVMVSNPVDVVVAVTGSDGSALHAQVQYVGAPVRPTQIFVQTGEQYPDQSYNVVVGNVADALGNDRGEQYGSFIAPSAGTVCQVVDQQAPQVESVVATRPNQVRVRFSEQIHSTSAVAANFAIQHREGGGAPTVTSALLSGGGTEVVLLTSAQEIEAPYSLTVYNIKDLAQPPNVLVQQSVDFAGFGEHVPPTVRAAAVTPTLVWLKFDEPVTEATAGAVGNYAIDGLTVSRAEFSGAQSLRTSATNPSFAPLAEDQVLLTTSVQGAGQTYTVQVSGVQDLSGNAAATSATFAGVASAPQVTVVIEYLISRSATVFGAGAGGSSGVPGRALSRETLAREREGVFIRGSAFEADGATALAGHPVTVALGGFPARGQAEIEGFAGEDPRLYDDATHGDRVAGDGIYALSIGGVALGSTIAFKAFASFTVQYRDQNPDDPRAAMADATPGPSQYADGEEFPGNDNGCRLLADSDGDGRIVLRVLFGDEITYKRYENTPVFAWIDDVFERIP
ncbi:MAG: hypothetical protein JXR83_02655 [Deltaproteobacteria bacterium]|nr:hypothetical protein [Deltaproteobacteria bacterium]